MGALSLADLVGSSDVLAARLPGIERAATNEAPILIAGEPGTGRSLLAQLIHRASRRASGPLVEVDPATIPSDLFESELFGHRAGAFTGAVGTNPGRVGRADGGTLVLDHVEEIPVGSQAKLLRLLAEGRYTPLGDEERVADLRLVSIASIDLPERVARGAFRRDLYHRLEVLAFRLPALRDRREDLDKLARSLLDDICRRLDRPVPELAPSALDWMRDYGWPGNLRQLRNVLERALVESDEGALQPQPPTDVEAPPRRLEEVEREEIEKALRHTRGHQGEAARLLGISRKTLWEKRRRYGLP